MSNPKTTKMSSNLIDREKLSRVSKNFRYWQISRSWSRLLRLEGGVKKKSRFLDLDRDFSIVERSFLKLSWFSLLSRFSQLLRPFLCKFRDWDKLRPPSLHTVYNQYGFCYFCTNSMFLENVLHKDAGFV